MHLLLFKGKDAIKKQIAKKIELQRPTSPEGNQQRRELLQTSGWNDDGEVCSRNETVVDAIYETWHATYD